ncbi:MAG TPA: hypothetical protein QF624_08660 [Dehalococcoidia bacterium]|nr:hypothetical protein [Dehalococcoidia bacterium]
MGTVLRRLLMLAALVVLATLAVGCGGASDSPPTADATASDAAATSASSTTEQAATATLEPTEVPATVTPTAVPAASTEVPAAPTDVPTAVPAVTATELAATEVPTAVPTVAPAATSTPLPTVEPTPEPTTTDGGCVSNPQPVLTQHYTDLTQIDFINPTIVTSGNWLKNRQYHKIVTDSANDAPEVPLYAPVDSVAIGITHYLAQMVAFDGTASELPQLEVRFEVSCEVSYWFDHVSRLVEPFASLASPEPARDTRGAMVPIRLEVKAGDLIGYTSGTAPARVWDFVIVNSTVTVQFANQARYVGTGDLQTILHSVCPVDYLAPELRAAYTALYGAWDGRLPGIACDTQSDVVGTIAGGWFLTPFTDTTGFGIADWGLVAKIAGDGSVDVNGPGTSVRTPRTH